MALTPSEKFVFDLCNNTFLKLWCHDNPIGKKAKELCDVLIVCGNDIIIFSVKEININPSEDSKVDDDRWIKRAVENSAKQLYGAERIIGLKDKIVLKDFKTALQVSYFWDALIDDFIKHQSADSLIVPMTRSDLDAAIFMMARESRLSRLALSTLFIELIKNQDEPRIDSRMLQSPKMVMFCTIGF